MSNKNEEINGNEEVKESKLHKFRRIAALTGVILLVAMYLVSLIAAILKSPMAKAVFTFSLYCTFVVPVIIYLLQLIYKLGNKKNDD